MRKGDLGGLKKRRCHFKGLVYLSGGHSRLFFFLSLSPGAGKILTSLLPTKELGLDWAKFAHLYY